MPIYKHGKQNNIMSFADVKQRVLDTNISISSESFFWLLYYCGVRKSEAYERVAEDFEITDTHLVVDFHQRKKGGDTVAPLELPTYWYGVDKIVAVVTKASKSKPRKKAVWQYSKGKRWREFKTARWVWPRIGSVKAWQIVSGVLGEGYYPHFLRLNRLSEIAQDPTASLTRLKSFSGIKSVKSLSAYLGTSKKEQKAALAFMDQQQS